MVTGRALYSMGAAFWNDLSPAYFSDYTFIIHFRLCQVIYAIICILTVPLSWNVNRKWDVFYIQWTCLAVFLWKDFQIYSKATLRADINRPCYCCYQGQESLQESTQKVLNKIMLHCFQLVSSNCNYDTTWYMQCIFLIVLYLFYYNDNSTFFKSIYSSAQCIMCSQPRRIFIIYKLLFSWTVRQTENISSYSTYFSV